MAVCFLVFLFLIVYFPLVIFNNRTNIFIYNPHIFLPQLYNRNFFKKSNVYRLNFLLSPPPPYQLSIVKNRKYFTKKFLCIIGKLIKNNLLFWLSFTYQKFTNKMWFTWHSFNGVNSFFKIYCFFFAQVSRLLGARDKKKSGRSILFFIHKATGSGGPCQGPFQIKKKSSFFAH